MSIDDLDELLYPKVAIGRKLTVWCLEFPPRRRDGKIWTRLLEELDVEIVMIEQQDHPPDPATTDLIQRIEARDGRKLPQNPFRLVLGKDASGRAFHNFVAMQFAEKDRIMPSFVVPSSIKKGGGSPEWWTPELFRRNGWHLLEDE